MRQKLTSWNASFICMMSVKNNFGIPKQIKIDRFDGLFLFPKIGKIKWGKFGNLANRNAIISRTELQTEKHRQSAEFSKFPDKGKLQFNEQNYNHLTNRNAIRLQTERKKMRKEKKEAKKRNRVKERLKRSKEYIYIYYNNALENQSIIIISVGQTRPRQTAPNKFF